MTVDDLIADPRDCPRCPECAARMAWRQRKLDGRLFLSCTRFPTCRGAISRAQLEKMLAKHRTAGTLAAARSKKLRNRGVT